jgi:hypothetical protein
LSSRVSPKVSGERSGEVTAAHHPMRGSDVSRGISGKVEAGFPQKCDQQKQINPA